MARIGRIGTNGGPICSSLSILLLMSLVSCSLAYRPGDIVPMSKTGQYHTSRTVWHDMIGRHCPIFAVNREALIPIPKPTGYTGADPYKISFQVGREKFLIPWLLVINRKGPEVPMIDVNLVLWERFAWRHGQSFRYATSLKRNGIGGPLFQWYSVSSHFVHSLPKVRSVSNPSVSVVFWEQPLCAFIAKDLEIHPDIHKQFWDPQHWPKHVLVRYTWKEQSEIDVTSGFYVLFGSGLLMTFILTIYILQSSQDKFAKFVMETVAETSMPAGGVAKVE